MKRRIFSVFCILLILAGITFGAWMRPGTPAVSEDAEDTQEEPIVYDKEAVYLWYTDDALTNFLTSAAVEYNEIHDTRVLPVLKSGLDFLEAVNHSTIESNVPDLYIVTHDSLEKAYLAGLAEPAAVIADDDPVLSRMKDEYLSTSLDAVSYKDKILAYPFYFDTTALLYNRSYLRDMALSRPEGDDIDRDDPANAEIIDEMTDKILPETMEEITALADTFDAPENVESFFTWDVTDIFYNYFFLGEAIDMGGKAGWDPQKLDIYNEDAIRALEEYQSLNQFFSIDSGASDYDKVMEDFIDGKLVFTIATTDAVAKIENAKAEGSFDFDYGVTLVPDLSDEKITRSLSITSCMVVNPFSAHIDTAKDFASFATVDRADSLYRSAHKVSAARNPDYGNDALAMFAREYDYSIPLSKLPELSNLWVHLEAAFSKIWNGEDANATLKELAEQMMFQVNGERPDLPKIELVYEKEEEEYLDEEALRNEALSEGDGEGAENSEASGEQAEN